MRRTELLTFLADEIGARKQEGRPLKVGIDGRCAAGKTMLADELGRVLSARGFDVLRPSVDGFHHPREHRYRQGEYSARGYYEDAYDYDAVVSALLGPLSVNSILLFEGIFVFRALINQYWDFRILVDVDADTSLARSLVRDTGLIGPAEVVRRKLQARYEPAWQMYVNEEDPEAKADVVIDNRVAASPRILRPRLRNTARERYPKIS
jgi:uridine kinase